MASLPPEPTDKLYRLSKRVVDKTRTKIQKLGLRTYRTYIVDAVWTGEERGEGELEVRTWTEILPSPEVRFSGNRPMTPGGSSLEGTARIRKISRQYRREELRGLGLFGDPRAENSEFFVALLASGQHLAELYKPSGEPFLDIFGWSISLTPANRQLPGPGPT